MGDNEGLDVPQADDVRDLALEWARSDKPWVTAVTAWANDGGVVTVTWDEVARSVHVRWVEAGEDRLLLERETATKVSISGDSGLVEFHIWSEVTGLAGHLALRVGRTVTITDALLRN